LVDKNSEAETKRQHINLAAALCSYYSTLDDEGDEIDWDRLSDEEFEFKMEKLNVKERERITYRDIALGRVTRTWHIARVASQSLTVDPW
jgi:hypothetical protein